MLPKSPLELYKICSIIFYHDFDPPLLNNVKKKLRFWRGRLLLLGVVQCKIYDQVFEFLLKQCVMAESIYFATDKLEMLLFIFFIKECVMVGSINFATDKVLQILRNTSEPGGGIKGS